MTAATATLGRLASSAASNNFPFGGARTIRALRVRFPWFVGHAWILLATWFVAMNVVHLGQSRPAFDSTLIGTDARLYIDAADTWLHGGDPWTVSQVNSTGTYHFTNPPLALQVFAPLTVLPREAAVWLWMAITVAAAVFTVWRLRRPPWWLLFPPLVEGVLAGNPHVVMLGLLVAAGPLTAAAALFKPYAVVPMLGEGRWRAVLIVLALLVASFAAAPSAWLDYFGVSGELARRLSVESGSGFSAWAVPATVLVTAIAIGALSVLDRRTAGWLAVPALWPSSQFFYGSLALPVAGPVMATALALPLRTVPAFVVVVFTMVRLVGWYRGRTNPLRTPPNLPEADRQ